MDAENSNQIHELLDHAEWLRALARRLVSDPVEQDEIQQDVWLVALARQRERVRDVRAWLARVAHNRVAEVFRARGRRTSREVSAAVPEALPSSERLVEEAELQRALVGAVLELTEPYRSTILLRFYRDLSPTEIAANEGVPAATIRSRLSRGIAQLRERLDRRFHGRRDSWVGMLAPLAAVPARAFYTSGAAAVAAGGLLMKIGVGVAAVLLVAGAVVAFRWLGGGDAGDAVDVAVVSESRAEAVVPPPTSVAIEDPTPSRRAAETAGSVETAAAVDAGPYEHVGFVGTADRQRLSGATITVLAPTDDGTLVATELVMTSREDGSFDVPASLPRDGSRRLLARHPGYASLLRPLTREIPILPLVPATRFEGYVTDAATGAPVAGVSIRVGRVVDPVGAVTSDVNGFYAHDRVPKEPRASVVAIAPGRSPFMERVAVDLATTVQRHDIVLPAATSFRGRVVDVATGDPVAGARLKVVHEFAETGADGTFRFAAPDGKARVQIHKRGFSSVSVKADTSVAPGGDFGAIPLVRSCRVEGRVVDAEDRPLAGATIRVQWDDSFGTSAAAPFLDRPLPADGRLESGAVGTFRTDESGRFEIDALTPYHRYLGLSVTHASFPATLLTGPFSFERPGDVHVEEIRLASVAVIEGVVRGANASDRARIDCVGGAQSGAAECDAEGRYRIDLLDAGTFRVTARLLSSSRSGMQTVPVARGETVRVDFDFSAPAVVAKGRLLDAHGRPVAAALLQVVARNASSPLSGWPFRAAADGTFERPVEAEPGEVLELRVQDQGIWHRFVAYAGAENARDFVMPETGVVRLRCLGPGRVDVSWRPSGSAREFESVLERPSDDGTVTFHVPTGAVDLRVSANGCESITIDRVMVGSGAPAEVEAALKPTDAVDGLATQGSGA